MFPIVFLTLVLLSESRAELPHSWDCVDGARKNVIVNETNIPGSFIVTYCAPVADGKTTWDLRVGTLPNVSPSSCIFSSKTENRHTERHSSVLIPVQNGNCSRVCITTQLYLMYRGCYRLENRWTVGEPYNKYYFVANNITGPEYFCNGSLFFHNLETDPPTFHLYQGHVPVDGYVITVASNATENEPETDISRECSPLGGAAGLRCAPRLAPGCHRLQLQLSAPWFDNTYYADHCRLMHRTFCWEPAAAGAGAGGGAARGAWLGGGVLLAALAAALLLLLARRWPRWRSHREEAAKALRKRLDTMRAAADAAATARAGGAGAGGGGALVLLLRARDAPPASRAQAALLRLLRLAAPGRVHDLFEADAVALSAASPAAWLREALARPDLRVVLLQTPAMACLHRRRLDLQDDALRLREPLLPQHVVYRSPHPADALLQFALRLLADGPPAPAPYRRYYLATLADVPVDVFPSVVPYSRYELPAAALALLREIEPTLQESAPLLAAVQALAEASKDLADYVHTNHNYLADELMFL